MSEQEPSAVVASARSWIGTPYHDQASLKGAGADCLGLARGIWRELVGPEPTGIPPYSRDWGESGGSEILADGALGWMIPESIDKMGEGSLVIFRMARGAIAKHIGILTGAGTFVHAYERLGVIEEPLTTAWARRIAYSFRFPAAE